MPKAARRTTTIAPPMTPPPGDPLDDGDDDPEVAAADAALGDLISLDGPEYESVIWYVYRLADGNDGRSRLTASDGRYCARIDGPLDLEHLVSVVGGGRFRLFGKWPQGFDRPPVRKVISLEGDPIVRKASPAASSTPDAAIDVIMRRLDAIDSRISAPPAPPASPLGVSSITELITLARSLAPPPPTESVIGAFTKGLDIGRESAGDDGGGMSLWKSIGPALVGLLAQGMKSQPAPALAAPAAAPASTTPAAPGQPPAAPTSTTPAAPGQPPADTSGERQLADVIVRMFRLGREPVAAADALEALLPDDVLEQIVTLGPATVLEAMRAQPWAAEIPELAGAELPAWLAGVVTELAAAE